MKTKILVTGCSGFVGKNLCLELRKNGYYVRGTSRNHHNNLDIDDLCVINDITSQTDWTKALESIDVIIHLASRVHILNEKSLDPLQEFLKTNTFGSLELAKQAKKHGIKKFIFMSSISVYGKYNGIPFHENMNLDPQTDYAISKAEAEKELLKLHSENLFHVIIMRPPMIYGINAPGNFKRLIKLVDTGIPIPLAFITNKRSLISVDNLCTFILNALQDNRASGQIFNVSDSYTPSTSELIELLIQHRQSKTINFFIPKNLMKIFFKMIRLESIYAKLFESLLIDTSKALNISLQKGEKSFKSSMQKACYQKNNLPPKKIPHEAKI